MELQGVVKKWGFRLLKLFILFSLTTCLSVISYWRLYSSWSKKDVNMLPVYFDFRGEESFANVSLVMDNLPRSRSKPFSIKLENGQTYSIQSMFYVAKSPRNQQLGKVTVVMNMIDSGGEVVESSLRPLIVPYHSSTYLFLESVFLFPLKFLNLNELYQYQLIMLDMFSDYTERHVAYPATTRIEVILSDSQIDLSNSYIIISRKLSWIRFVQLSFQIFFSTKSLNNRFSYL